MAIRRQLAQANPQAFLPDLAMSLNNLGNVALRPGPAGGGAGGDPGGGGDLPPAWPRPTPRLSSPTWPQSLNNLGIRLSELGRREEALAATQEAVEIYRQLAQANPQAFLPNLARSLNNLGNRLSALGRREEALAATQEAVEIRRQLAQAHPQAFLPDLARSLGAHGFVLLGLGRAREARAAFAEGLRAILPFLRALPAAFGELAAALLQGYLRACEEAGEAPEAGLAEEVRRHLG